MHRVENEKEKEEQEGKGRLREAEARSSRSFVHLPRINYSAPLSEPNPTRDSGAVGEGGRENADALTPGVHHPREAGPGRRRERARTGRNAGGLGDARRWWKSERENREARGGGTRVARMYLDVLRWIFEGQEHVTIPAALRRSLPYLEEGLFHFILFFPISASRARDSRYPPRHREG